MQLKYIFLTQHSIFGKPSPNNKEPSAPGKFIFSPHLFSSLKRLGDSGYQFKIISTEQNDFSLFYQILASESIKGLDKKIFQIKKNDPPSALLADTLLFARDNNIDLKTSAFVHTDDSFSDLAKNLKINYFQLMKNLGWSTLANLLITAPRIVKEKRTTKETEVEIELNLDGNGMTDIDTGIPFFDHLLSQLGKHSNLDLIIHVQGDLEVDEHHTVEDTAITLGQTLKKALSDKRGIRRYSFLLPMDESLIQCALDLSGRNHLVFDGEFKREKIGDLPTELIKHFYLSLCEHLGATLHLKIRGENEHHKIEGSFKAFAKCLKEAVAREGTELPSTKGSL